MSEYYDSAADERISYDRAMKELRDHGVTAYDEIKVFLKEVGDRAHYDAQEVLRWLGY